MKVRQHNVLYFLTTIVILSSSTDILYQINLDGTVDLKFEDGTEEKGFDLLVGADGICCLDIGQYLIGPVIVEASQRVILADCHVQRLPARYVNQRRNLPLTEQSIHPGVGAFP